MPGENPFSQVPDLKGISVELPFCSFKYVKVQRNFSEKSDVEQCVTKPPVRARQPAPATAQSRVILTRAAEVTTFGMDPMVSQAAVIHELAHGRIASEFDDVFCKKEALYPFPKEEVGHSVDLFI